MIKNFISYLETNSVGTLVHYLIYIMLIKYALFSPVLASCMGALAGACINYRLNYFYTFHSHSPHSKTMTKYLIVSFIGYLLNILLMYISINIYMMNYIVAQMMASFFVATIGYMLNRYWSFAIPHIS